MLPHDPASRATTFGLVDASAQAVVGAKLSDLDPLERERLRQSVQQYGGNRVLLELEDEALDGALGLTARQSDGTRVPALTGLLLLGKEPALRELAGRHYEQRYCSLEKAGGATSFAMKVTSPIYASFKKTDNRNKSINSLETYF